MIDAGASLLSSPIAAIAGDRISLKPLRLFASAHPHGGSTMSFLQSLLPWSRPKANTGLPEILSYGQETSEVPFKTIQSVMEWLFASAMNAGYRGKLHMFWHNDTLPDPGLRAVKAALRKDELVLLYRCGDRVQKPPSGYYWRLMPEYPSLRIYQLEVKD